MTQAVKDLLPERPENKDRDWVNWILILLKGGVGFAAVFAVWQLDQALRSHGCRFFSGPANITVSKGIFLMVLGLGVPDSVRSGYEWFMDSPYIGYALDLALILVLAAIFFKANAGTQALEQEGCKGYYQEFFPERNVSDMSFYGNLSSAKDLDGALGQDVNSQVFNKSGNYSSNIEDLSGQQEVLNPGAVKP